MIKSHPSRGAWIEIELEHIYTELRKRRTPRGVRGLKYIDPSAESLSLGRTPRGVRGLKSLDNGYGIINPTVAPLAGCVD